MDESAPEGKSSYTLCDVSMDPRRIALLLYHFQIMVIIFHKPEGKLTHGCISRMKVDKMIK
jgi:hypothetical protein